MAASALYLHIPFCHARCAYCDFESRARTGERLRAESSAYLGPLLDRIDAFGRAGALAHLKTAYIGGGTPTVLGRALADVVSRIRRWSAPTELTCGATPESFTLALAVLLARAGATRISFGVQSLEDAELAAIGRLHRADEARAAVASAQDAGLDVSCDLMCGLPGQTAPSWARTLEGSIAMGVSHVSVYPLQLEEGTLLARRAGAGEVSVPDEDFQADAMDAARAALRGAGFRPYEVASYALPGHECAHNKAYWTGEGYIGIGRSAAGMLPVGDYLALRDLIPFDELVPAGTSRVRFRQLDDAGSRFEPEFLTGREAVSEDLMLACRMTAGIPRALIERAKALIGAAEVEGACGRAVRLGLASYGEGGRLAPTKLGWLEGNELFELFWDLADP